MERDESDATISDGSELSFDVPIETNKRQKDYKGVLDTLKDMSLSLRKSEVNKQCNVVVSCSDRFS